VSIQTVTATPRPRPPVQAIRWTQAGQWFDIERWRGVDPKQSEYANNWKHPQWMYDDSGRPFSIGDWLVKEWTDTFRAYSDEEFVKRYTVEAKP